jgi:DNA-binding response OmpR family regulator
MDVLLIEDDAGSQLLIRQAILAVGADWHLHVAETGDEAMARLGQHQAPTPDLIILDLNLPGKGGIEVLREIRNLTASAATPVVVLSGSSAVSDIAACAGFANCTYVPKPQRFAELVEMVRSLAA